MDVGANGFLYWIQPSSLDPTRELLAQAPCKPFESREKCTSLLVIPVDVVNQELSKAGLGGLSLSDIEGEKRRLAQNIEELEVMNRPSLIPQIEQQNRALRILESESGVVASRIEYLKMKSAIWGGTSGQLEYNLDEYLQVFEQIFEEYKTPLPAGYACSGTCSFSQTYFGSFQYQRWLRK